MVEVKYVEVQNTTQITAANPTQGTSWVSLEFPGDGVAFDGVVERFDSIYGKGSYRFLFWKNDLQTNPKWVEYSDESCSGQTIALTENTGAVFIVLQKKDSLIKELEERVTKQRSLIEKANKIITANKANMQEKDTQISSLQQKIKEIEGLQSKQDEVIFRLESELKAKTDQSSELLLAFDELQSRFDNMEKEMDTLRSSRDRVFASACELEESLNSTKKALEKQTESQQVVLAERDQFWNKEIDQVRTQLLSSFEAQSKLTKDENKDALLLLEKQASDTQEKLIESQKTQEKAQKDYESLLAAKEHEIQNLLASISQLKSSRPAENTTELCSENRPDELVQSRTKDLEERLNRSTLELAEAIDTISKLKEKENNHVEAFNQLTHERNLLRDKVNESEEKHSKSVGDLAVHKEELENRHGALVEQLNGQVENLKTEAASLAKEKAQLLSRIQSMDDENNHIKAELLELRSKATESDHEISSQVGAVGLLKSDLDNKNARIKELEALLEQEKNTFESKVQEIAQQNEAATKKLKEDHHLQLEKMKTIVKDRVSKYEIRINEMEKKHADSTKTLTEKISETLEENSKSMRSKDQKIRDLTSEIESAKKELSEREDSKRFDFISVSKVSKSRDSESADPLKDRWCLLFYRSASGEVIRQGWEQASVVVQLIRQGKHWTKSSELDLNGPSIKLLPPSIEETYEKQITDLEARFRKVVQQSEDQISALRKENEDASKKFQELDDEYQKYKIKAANAMKHHSGQQDTQKHELMKANEELKSRLSELNESIIEMQSEHMSAVQQMGEEYHILEKKLEDAIESHAKAEILWKQRTRQIEGERDLLKAESEKAQVQYDAQVQFMRGKHTELQEQLQILTQELTVAKEENEQISKSRSRDYVVKKTSDVSVQTSTQNQSIPLSGSTQCINVQSDVVETPTEADAVSQVSTTSETIGVSGSFNYVFEYEQSQKENELKRLRQQIRELTISLDESHSTEKLLVEQKKFLEQEIREFERARKREEVKDGAVNMQYLKNVVVKYLQTDEESLFPVMATLLQFSPEEIRLIHEEREKRTGIAVVSTTASSAASGLWSFMDSYLRPM